jgi:DNA topoisomerase IA
MKVCIAEKPSVAREIASVLELIQNMMAIMKATAMLYTFGHLCF